MPGPPLQRSGGECRKQRLIAVSDRRQFDPSFTLFLVIVCPQHLLQHRTAALAQLSPQRDLVIAAEARHQTLEVHRHVFERNRHHLGASVLADAGGLQGHGFPRNAMRHGSCHGTAMSVAVPFLSRNAVAPGTMSMVFKSVVDRNQTSHREPGDRRLSVEPVLQDIFPAPVHARLQAP